MGRNRKVGGTVAKPSPSESARLPVGVPRAHGNVGNKHALKHGLHSPDEVRRREQDPLWAAAQEETARILDVTGLTSNPLAQRIARRMAQAEFESALLERYCTRRGRTDRKGSLKPAYNKMLDLRGSDLNECRRLLDQLKKATTPVSTYADLILASYDLDTDAAQAAPSDDQDQAHAQTPRKVVAHPGAAQDAPRLDNSQRNGARLEAPRTHLPPTFSNPVTQTTQRSDSVTPSQASASTAKKAKTRQRKPRATHSNKDDLLSDVKLDDGFDYFAEDDPRWTEFDLL